MIDKAYGMVYGMIWYVVHGIWYGMILIYSMAYGVCIWYGIVYLCAKEETPYSISLL